MDSFTPGLRTCGVINNPVVIDREGPDMASFSGHGGSEKFSRAEKWFLRSAVVVFFLTAVAKAVSFFGSDGILGLQDPVTGLSNRTMLALGTVAELLVCAIIVASRNRFLKSLAVWWLACVLVIYRAFWHKAGALGWCPCLGKIVNALPLTPVTEDLLMGVITITLLCLSSLFLIGHHTRLKSSQ